MCGEIGGGIKLGHGLPNAARVVQHLDLSPVWLFMAGRHGAAKTTAVDGAGLVSGAVSGFGKVKTAFICCFCARKVCSVA